MTSHAENRSVLRSAVAIAVLTLAASMAAGVAGARPGGTQDAGPRAGQINEYVALGDSFAAGPLILPQKDLDRITPCTRSEVNYPSLLAKRLGVKKFKDVSCSGAVTADIDRGSQGRSLLGARIAPQVSSLSRSTDLVTLTIGGNDAGLVGIAQKCAYRMPSPRPCATERVTRAARADVEAVRPAITRVIRAIKSRAPHARVLVTSYTNYADVKRSNCTFQFVHPSDIAALQNIVGDLARVQREAAAVTGAEFVDLITPAIGHDGCSAAPWANAAQPIVNVRDFSIAFHPTAAGERGFARVLARHLAEPATR